MDELSKSITASEELGKQLPKLRQDKSIEGLIKYNEVLVEALDRQINLHTRLRLMGDRESVQIADEMEYTAEKYMGKQPETSFAEFIDEMKEEIGVQLKVLNQYKG